MISDRVGSADNAMEVDDDNSTRKRGVKRRRNDSAGADDGFVMLVIAAPSALPSYDYSTKKMAFIIYIVL